MQRRQLLLYVCIFLIGLGIGWVEASLQKLPQSTSSNIDSSTPVASSSAFISNHIRQKATVKRVIDGDTIELTDGRKLRYIGMDTPETVDPNRPVGCFGKEASDKNKELVLGKEVELEKDVSETDKYGRLLRYVYLSDGIMINETLVQEGFAFARTYPPDVKYQDKFLEAERSARDNNKGLWGTCTTNINTQNSSPTSVVQGATSENSPLPIASGCLIKGNISANGDKIYHLPNCGSYAKTVIDESTGEHWFCTEDEAQKAGWRKAKNC